VLGVNLLDDDGDLEEAVGLKENRVAQSAPAPGRIALNQLFARQVARQRRHAKQMPVPILHREPFYRATLRTGANTLFTVPFPPLSLIAVFSLVHPKESMSDQSIAMVLSRCGLRSTPAQEAACFVSA